MFEKSIKKRLREVLPSLTEKQIECEYIEVMNSFKLAVAVTLIGFVILIQLFKEPILEFLSYV